MAAQVVGAVDRVEEPGRPAGVGRAAEFLTDEEKARMPGGENSRRSGFYQNIDWWEANRDRINRAWSRWILR